MQIQPLFAPPHPSYSSRREFLKRAGNGAGLVALASLLAQEGLLESAAAAETSDSRERALADFCQVLFGLNEFVYVE